MINLTTAQKENLELILQGTKYKHVNADGQLIFTDTSEELVESELQAYIDSFDLLVPAKITAKARIVDQAQSYMQQIESEYPSFERATWPTQKAEIEAWEADNTSKTPLLDNIATARGMSRVELLNRTLVKVHKYNTQAAILAGKRQKAEDEIENSSDLTFIKSINFEP